MKKRVLSLCLVLVMAIGFLPTFSVANAATGGKCGQNLTWSLDGSVLTISGTGDMYDYSYGNAPWDKNFLELVVKDGVTSIGDCAFYECKKLETVQLAGTIRTIGDASFYYCRNLVDFTVPEGVTKIGYWAFGLCTFLDTIIFPESLTSIGEYAFSNCKFLRNITIPDSVTKIGEEAFCGCRMLADDDGFIIVKNILYGYYGKSKNIVIPQGVTYITRGLFFHSFEVESVVVPEGVQKIAPSTFGYSYNLKSVSLPGSLLSVDKSAFDGCESLKTVNYGGTEAQLENVMICERNDSLLNATWIFSSTPSDKQSQFDDVRGNKWYTRYINYSVAHNIFKGTAYRRFSPNNNITRAQFVQVLANIEGVDTHNVNVATMFDDVPKGKWYAPAVKWASDNGVVNGFGDGTFRPDDSVTREQMCVMLINYANYKRITVEEYMKQVSFDDDKDIAHWSKDAVYKCQKAGIVQGKGYNKFDPKGFGTRAEASKIFTIFYSHYIQKEVEVL